MAQIKSLPLHLENLRKIFIKSVESVRPANLFDRTKYALQPKLDENKRVVIKIQGKTFDISRKRCHVVGFGKAVLGMAVQLEKSLEKRLVSGVLSIPLGTLKQFKDDSSMQLSADTKIEIFEGAPNNQPDQVALEAAKNIKELAERMGENDILFVLISGGGSALLPMPKIPIQLEQKQNLIKRISLQGASIDEMNIVRIALSDVKGGRLAVAAKKAFAVISFVISDIVNDPVDLIASGPTSPIRSRKLRAHDILKKYHLWQDLTQEVQNMIQNDDIPETPGLNNTIYIVGDNKVATETSVSESVVLGYNPFILSTSIQGTIDDVLKSYKILLESLKRYQNEEITEDDFLEVFPFDCRIFKHFIKTVQMSKKAGKPLLLILAGEPTVHVIGSGVGGRNQELAMRMSLELFTNPLLRDVCFLSAGTDGIDGPCSAAGAIGCSLVVEEFLKTAKMEELNKFLEENDSYNFYKNLCDGCFHVVTGHTGTNVMDLHFILVS
ncbi:glycerate kinase [Episyrphus balteatus]|uniref:glycerate kinase n=1 Tax=Episyrphus balteatus TaxID=286459 RepID=UPI0024859543|nr:glycerate kinase [Episyrphus balteatus]